jgi:methionyl-tRNA synthetase
MEEIKNESNEIVPVVASGTIMIHRPQKAEISIEQFDTIDIRVCLIKSVERVPKKDRLFKLEIDTGIDTRTVICGIAHKIGAGQLLNCKVPFVLNLKPVTIAGIESTAMIILSENQEDNVLSFVGRDESKVNVGAIII